MFATTASTISPYDWSVTPATRGVAITLGRSSSGSVGGNRFFPNRVVIRYRAGQTLPRVTADPSRIYLGQGWKRLHSGGYSRGKSPSRLLGWRKTARAPLRSRSHESGRTPSRYVLQMLVEAGLRHVEGRRFSAPQTG
jgi:hypothetical protein